MRIALTGTPTRGKELNMWGIMNWLWPSTYSSKWDWVETYFESSKNNWGGIDIGPLREDMRERFWAMLDKHTLRRTRREVRADLPEAESYTEWVHLAGKHAKQYDDMLKTGEASIDGGEVITLGILAEMTRLKQFAFGVWEIDKNGNLHPTVDSPKVRRLDDMLEERGISQGGKEDFRATEQHYKYIVASQFKQIVDALESHYESLGIPTLKITGDITGARRASAVRSFQEDPDGPRIMLMTAQAGGESITLDRYCDTIFALDESFVADDGLQLLGRIDNRSVSAEESVPRRVIHLSTKGTIEEGIAQSNISQLEMEHLLLDSRRGIELAKSIMSKVS
jgi:SNF2 family DNA or RNA helicase